MNSTIPAPKTVAVRLDSLSVGSRFMSKAGERFEITGWYLDRVGGCPLVKNLDREERTMFAGCAEGVVLP